MAADADSSAKVAPEEEKVAETTTMPSKDKSEEESSDKVAEAPSKVAAVKGDGSKDEAKVEHPKASEAQQACLVLGCLAVAFIVAVVQHSAVLEGGNFMTWVDSLSAEHVVPPPIARDNVVTVQFCQSWGTNGMYNQISQLIQTRASESLTVQPVGYPAPPLMQFYGTIVGIFQVLIILNMFVNDKLMPETVRENKMASVFGVFMVLNMVSSGLTKTNAFEMYVGRKQVYSMMKTGRQPNMQDLIAGFKKVGITFAT